VLSFIESDVVDLYRCVAVEAARMVPPPGAPVEEEDTRDLDGEAETFIRYLTVLEMAVADARVPADVRETVRRVRREMDGWNSALAVLLRRLEAEHLVLAAGDGEERTG
jgi:hypothetical protein